MQSVGMRSLLLALVIATTGCGDFGFDQLLVEPACAEWDAWCRGQTLGTRLAQGARLDLRLGSRTTLTSGADVTLESSDPSIFSTEDRALVGVSPGTAVLLFRSDGRLLDYTHVTVEAVDDVALYREGELEPEPFPASLVLSAGDSFRIRAVPRGVSGPLLGDIDTVFRVTGENVDAISLDEGSRAIERVLSAASLGTAIVEVEQGGLSDALEVSVR